VADPQRARFSFRFGAVFEADERHARYVAKLSVALEDLRTAARYAGRSRQRAPERLYFVRLMAAHLRELILLIDPNDTTVVPSAEEFVAALPRGTRPSRAEIRAAHRAALRQLDRPMAQARPAVRTPKRRRRRPKLRDDLRELRHRFFHYGHDAGGDAAVLAAMQAVAHRRTSYVVKTRTKRAEYAHLIGEKLAHPYEPRFAREMHEAIFDLLGPVARYVQLVEEAWLAVHAEDIVLRLPGRPPARLAALLK
jgi:hypothetical protein